MGEGEGGLAFPCRNDAFCCVGGLTERHRLSATETNVVLGAEVALRDGTRYAFKLSSQTTQSNQARH